MTRWPILLVLILFVAEARSTVCLLLVTPDAVVIGTDSKQVEVTSNSLLIGQDEKVVSIAQGRVIVGTAGLAKLTHHGRRGTRETYNFPTWVRALPIKAGTPIMQVANVLASESFKIMNEEISQDTRNGKFSPPPNFDPSLPLVVYFVGECGASGCSAVTVTIMVDWKKWVVNRPEIRMEFPKKVPTAWTASWSSVDRGGLDRFLTGDSSTRQRYQHDYPSEIDPLLSGFALTPEEALNASKLLLSLAINERPDLYSFPAVVYLLSSHHAAKRYEYKQ